MFKNKKGFSLIELTAIIMIIGILTSISLPSYKTSVARTKIAVNMPLLRAMQNGAVHFYDLNGFLPSKIVQLPINKSEFKNITNTSAVHISSNCTFGWNKTALEVTETCGSNWTLTFPLVKTALGYRTGIPTFTIHGDEARLNKIAQGFGWEEIGDNVYNIK